MSFVVVKDGKVAVERDSKSKCVAEILIKGWLLEIGEFGCVFALGIRILEKKDDGTFVSANETIRDLP